MSGSGPPSRRFDEEEFGLILRRAAELQEEGPDAVARQRGLTLEEIRQIAAEAGIDPRHVDRAVAGLAGAGDREAHPLLGAPYGWRFERTVDGRVPPEALGRVLDAVRSVLRQKGEVEDVFGTMEWSYDDQLGPVLVRVVPEGEATRVEVSAQRGGEVGIVYSLTATVGTVVGAAALTRLLGLSGAEAGLTFLGAGGASWLGARTIWGHMSRRWEGKLRTLLDRVAHAAEAAAERVTGADAAEDRLPPADAPPPDREGTG